MRDRLIRYRIKHASSLNRAAVEVEANVLLERVDDVDSDLFEVVSISRDDGEVIHECGRSGQTVFYWHGVARRSKRREKFRPPESAGRVPWDAVNSLDSLVEPEFQPRSTFAHW